MTTQQVNTALQVTKADMAIDQLKHLQSQFNESRVEMLQKALVDAQQVIEELKEGALQKVREAAEEEAQVFYSNGTLPPRTDLKECTGYMRVGHIRRIERFIQVDPIFVVCVEMNSSSIPWEDRFRVVDSERAAEGVKVLHNV